MNSEAAPLDDEFLPVATYLTCSRCSTRVHRAEWFDHRKACPQPEWQLEHVLVAPDHPWRGRTVFV